MSNSQNGDTNQTQHNSQNWRNTGEQIKDALTDALQSGNFKNLNNLVSQTVSNAINEVEKHVVIGGDERRRDDRNPPQSAPGTQTGSFSVTKQDTTAAMPVWQQRAAERERQQQQKLQEVQNRQNQHKNLPAIKIKRVGNVSNVLYQVFGGIGLGITGFVTFIRTLVLLSGSSTTAAGWIFNLLFLSGFFGMVQIGIRQKKRLRRAERYLQLCDYRVYGEIATLAGGTGRSWAYVVKDLQKMLALGIFPEGHLDEQKTCFMLNDVVYKQYLEAENSRRIREAENRKCLEQNDAPPAEAVSVPEVSQEQASELNIMVAEGMNHIRKLRDLNDKISGEIISAKLFCLENLLKDIFDSVREHPKQMHRMHKLMNYYLPTTLKLVESYEEFDRVSSPGTEILKAKAEIENTLDTINQAFRELLNNLFQEAVFDATTDAQVLKTMLAKEGLTREMEFAAVSHDS